MIEIKKQTVLSLPLKLRSLNKGETAIISEWSERYIRNTASELNKNGFMFSVSVRCGKGKVCVTRLK